MPGGRPPKPTALKVLEGNKGKRSLPKGEPKPTAGVVSCPRGMDPEAQKVWRRLAPDLIARKVLTLWDVDAFRILCEQITHNRAANADLFKNGNRITVVDRELADGTITYKTIANPNWQIAKESAALIATYVSRFGLTPSDRAKLSLPEAPSGKSGERLLTSTS